MKLDESFYRRKNVVTVAKELLGKVLYTRIGAAITGGVIVETEAYSQRERGSHAFRGKTKRNKVMFETGGIAYVYLCYGVHHMFNVVTNGAGAADAVLVRALEPYMGEDVMMLRTGKKSTRRITSGPGLLTKALGITSVLNGKFLGGSEVWIENTGLKISNMKI